MREFQNNHYVRRMIFDLSKGGGRVGVFLYHTAERRCVRVAMAGTARFEDFETNQDYALAGIYTGETTNEQIERDLEETARGAGT